MNSAHGKQGPLYTPSAAPRRIDNPVIVSPQVPRLGRGGTSKTLLHQLKKVTALLAFLSISRFSAAFCLSRICGLTPQSPLLSFIVTSPQLTAVPPRDVQACPHADTPTAEMILQHGNNCETMRQICLPRRFLRTLKNTGFLKNAFPSEDRLCFLSQARQRPFFGGLFGVF